MSKASTKPGDDTDTGNGAGTGAGQASSAVEPNATAIRVATTDPDPSPDPPSIPDLLDRVTDIESQLASLLDDLAVAIPDMRAPAPIPSPGPSTSGAYAPAQLGASIDSLRERAASGDRAALLRYLRLRRT